MSRNNLKPLSEVMKDLKAKGFTKDFIYRDNQLVAMENKNSYSPEELSIIEEYRFEGDSDPGMMTILYALESKDGLKGTISDAYGANSDKDMADFMQQIKTVNRD